MKFPYITISIEIDLFFRFLRKGKVGGYHEDLNGDQIKRLDEWIAKVQKDTDFKFKM